MIVGTCAANDEVCHSLDHPFKVMFGYGESVEVPDEIGIRCLQNGVLGIRHAPQGFANALNSRILRMVRRADRNKAACSQPKVLEQFGGR